MPDSLPNWRRLETGGYVVRTQAGFNQARKDWYQCNGYDDWNPNNAEGYPTKYPSVVQLRYEFGPDRVYATCTPINDHKAYLAARQAELADD